MESAGEQLRSGQTSPTNADLEVENVMLLHRERFTKTRYLSSATDTKGLRSRRFSAERHASMAHRSKSETSSVRLPGLGSDGTRKSAFSPYKPTTVLTNLQRGNIETQTPCFIPDPSIHQLAAQGELILDSDVNDGVLNESDSEGLTPLIWAAAYGQVPTVSQLLEHNVNIHAENEHGENALLLASCNGHSDMVRTLLDRGMDVDHTDEHGNTALMYAAFNNHAHCAQELLQHKADITKENHYGDSAYCIAVARGSKQVQMILERHLLSYLDNM